MTHKENFTYVILAIFTTLLFADRYMLYGIILLAMAFVVILGRNHMLYSNSMLFVFIAIGMVAFVDMMLGHLGVLSDIFSLSVAKKEIFRVIIYFIIMEIMSSMAVDLKVYSKVWRGLLIFIVGIAILQFTKVFDIDAILKNIYGDSVQFYNSAHTEISSFRCGSVFINPNVFACFLVAMLGSYMFILQYIRENLVMKVLTFGMIITGFVLSGSRTGFLLGVIVLVTYISMESQGELDSIIKRMLILGIGVSVTLLIMMFYFKLDLSNFSALRLFKIDEGTTNSFGVKIGIFTNLLSKMDLKNALIGYGPFDYTSNSGSLLVDFDLGYFITYFGAFGVCIYAVFLRSIFAWGDQELYGRRYMNTVFLLIAIVFGMTAGVYFNLRIFSIYMLMFMPMICIKNEIVA